MNYVKIGYTNVDFYKRLKSYTTHSPFEHDVLLLIDGSKELEYNLQNMFGDFRVRTEWFHLSEEILKYVADNSHLNRYVVKTTLRHYRKFTQSQIDSIVQMYTNGVPFKYIVNSSSISSKSIRCLLKRLKVKRKK